MNRGELGEAVRPAGGDSVGRGGVHHAHIRVLDHGDRLAARVVREAEHGYVAAVEGVASLFYVPAFRAVKHGELDVRPAGEPGVDAQPGRAGAAVDEHFSHVQHLSKLIISVFTSKKLRERTF